MNGAELREARVTAGCTQRDAAAKLGVTQAYLSMVERGVRPVSAELASRVVAVFAVPATALSLGQYERRHRDELYFKQTLGALGYGGFAYLGGGHAVNPAWLLMEAIDEEDVDARVIEALPWLLLHYPALDWKWLTREAKIHDRQNRLAFLASVAAGVAEMHGDDKLARQLAVQVDSLDPSRLAAEDTLCQKSMTQAERRWLRVHATESAKHWNLLSHLTPDEVVHAFA